MRTYVVLLFLVLAMAPQAARDWDLEITQLTRGPMHHFFGYIGQARTIPWNDGNRYVVALRTTFQDRMPEAGEPADVVLIERSHPHDHDEGVPVAARLGEPSADAQRLLADDALHPHLAHERPDLVVHEDVAPDQAVGRRRRRGGDDEVGGVHHDGRRGENRQDGARTRGQRP